MINGNLLLNVIRVSLFFFRGTTCCEQIALYLLTFKSNTNTLPSVVTAAKTVLEYGAHFTSPTLAPKSNMKRGSLWGFVMKLMQCYQVCNKFMFSPSHILPYFDTPITTARNKDIGIKFIKVHTMH